MLHLDDPKWQEFEGGYKIPYDASVQLKKLENSTSTAEQDIILNELWDELHHQGDVGLASYYSVPHLIRIGLSNRVRSFNVFGLVAVIEIQRNRDNPILPVELEFSYLESIRIGLPELVEMVLFDVWDNTYASTILAALAVSKGKIDVADILLKLEDPDIVKGILEDY